MSKTLGAVGESCDSNSTSFNKFYETLDSCDAHDQEGHDLVGFFRPAPSRNQQRPCKTQSSHRPAIYLTWRLRYVALATALVATSLSLGSVRVRLEYVSTTPQYHHSIMSKVANGEPNVNTGYACKCCACCEVSSLRR